MRSLDRIVGKLAEVLPQLQRLLGSHRLGVGHPHVCDYAQFLFLGLCFCLFELLVKNLSIQSQLSTQHDVLLNKNSLLATVKRPASDLFALISDGWVRVKSRLLFPTFRRLDVGRRLPERRIVL